MLTGLLRLQGVGKGGAWFRVRPLRAPVSTPWRCRQLSVGFSPLHRMAQTLRLPHSHHRSRSSRPDLERNSAGSRQGEWL